MIKTKPPVKKRDQKAGDKKEAAVKKHFKKPTDTKEGEAPAVKKTWVDKKNKGKGNSKGNSKDKKEGKKEEAPVLNRRQKQKVSDLIKKLRVSQSHSLTLID